jgi:hypothetical protein
MYKIVVVKQGWGNYLSHSEVRYVYALINAEKNLEVMQLLLICGKRSPNKALNQALKLEATKAEARSPARLWEVTVESPWEQGLHK